MGWSWYIFGCFTLVNFYFARIEFRDLIVWLPITVSELVHNRGALTGRYLWISQDGRIVVSLFVDNKMQGEGRKIMIDGSFHEGLFEDGHFTSGTAEYPSLGMSY